jgi:hypothetical protein
MVRVEPNRAFDWEHLEEIEIERIRRNRRLTVRELLAQHDAAVRSRSLPIPGMSRLWSAHSDL